MTVLELFGWLASVALFYVGFVVAQRLRSRGRWPPTALR